MSWKNRLLVIGLAGVVMAACGALRSRKPLGTVDKYEELLVGRVDADYVGMDGCLSACHYHDALRNDLENSTMGQQVKGEGEGGHLVDCESCHGPGSLAIAGITPERVEEEAALGIDVACDFETLTPIAELPPGAKNLMCLKCHSGNANTNLHGWNSSEHASADVTCVDCHPIHGGPDMLVPFRQQSEMCFGCHDEYLAKIALPSRHPLLERKMACTSCHEPHGARGGKGLLQHATVKATCTGCHAEYRTPFAFAHADATEECGNCHDPHGSPNENLLLAKEPFLCLQCHPGHFIDSPSGAGSSLEAKGAFYTRCSTCHSSVHGSNTISPSGNDTFIR